MALNRARYFRLKFPLADLGLVAMIAPGFLKERAAEQRHAGKVNGMSFNVDKESHEEIGVK